MTHPRFRRPPPAPAGERPDDGLAATGVLRLIPDWDGRTWEFGGASVAGRSPDFLYSPPPPVTVVSVTVGDGTGARDQASARMHAALTYIRLKVAILERTGRAGRIDASEHARRRGDEVAPRSAVGEIRREAASLLRGAGA